MTSETVTNNQKNLPLPEIKELLKDCGYVFRDEQLLCEALTHTSYQAEHSEVKFNNQRLEFLGDAVLQMILTNLLYEGLPEASEGILTRTRSLLAKEETLAKLAEKLGLGRALLMGHGDISSGGRQRPSILCDVFESFLGAIYLDGGYQAARDYCLKLLPPVKDVYERLGIEENPKGALQEYCQQNHIPKPKYELTECGGPSHSPSFTVVCNIDGTPMGMGTAGSQRLAQKIAALEALEKIMKRNG